MIKKTISQKTISRLISRFFLACVVTAMPLGVCNAEESEKSGGLIQIGAMHEAIGQAQHQGRVDLAEIVAMPHFYGVGALEALRGEITILNSEAITTGVTQDGRPQPMESLTAKATMLAGQSVRAWMDIDLIGEVSHEQFDKTVETAAASNGIDAFKPFVFVIEGVFKDVRLHVINGACPIHARMKKLDVEKGEQPFELEAKLVNGTLVGVHAAGSAGKLTHPATSTHAHLIYIDEETGERVTGHIERIGLAKGTVLKLPDSGELGAAPDTEESRR